MHPLVGAGELVQSAPSPIKPAIVRVCPDFNGLEMRANDDNNYYFPAAETTRVNGTLNGENRCRSSDAEDYNNTI